MSARVLKVISLFLLLIGGWVGCRCRPAAPAVEPKATPSLRLVLFSSVAGALEPCGCVKDMLGGVTHAAAYLRAQSSVPSLLLASGPLLFADTELPADRKAQDEWKAEALLAALDQMGLRVWAPGANDFAAGGPELVRLAQKVKPSAPNLRSEGQALTANSLFVVGGTQVGVAAVSEPRLFGKLPAGVDADDALASLRAQASALVQRGAQLRVALLAMPRGDALRAIEQVPGFQVALIGKGVDRGETNDAGASPTRVGNTLVVETPNHLQAFFVVDLFVKEGHFVFEDAEQGNQQKSELEGRIAELEQRIRQAEDSSGVRAEDLAARRRDLEALKRELAAQSQQTTAPAGSYYRARSVEVRERLGADARVAEVLREYYRRVNDHNLAAFKDKLPLPAKEGSAGYVGIERCQSCHTSEYAFWKTTRHASAYVSLSSQFKQYNLDCVSCHVTGYEQPGGSTVAHVENLEDVQCEVCHGPGSRHAADPGAKSAIIAAPDKNLCAAKCHHLPHVKADWSADVAFPKIIGVGHGR